jgi:DtxR family transcriptional regulator, Mn-dependent transcriptional regulator
MARRKTPIEEEQEELLEEIWNLLESRKDAPAVNSKIPPQWAAGRDKVAVLTDGGYLVQRDDDLYLTEKGYSSARELTRHHRLAERLLLDVVNLDDDEVERTACQYEHLLDKDASESICILLGHPRTCPHGKPIPMGDCCVVGETTLRPFVVPVSELDAGETATVAYIGSSDQSRFAYLSSLGIMPGRLVELMQKYPSYVLKVEETSVAFSEDTAKNIFVRPSQRKRRAAKGGNIIQWLYGRLMRGHSS